LSIEFESCREIGSRVEEDHKGEALADIVVGMVADTAGVLDLGMEPVRKVPSCWRWASSLPSFLLRTPRVPALLDPTHRIYGFCE
jgi:hypothetical protein